MFKPFSDPHPTPPQGEEDRLDRLRLLRSRRVGPATYHRLLKVHGSAAAALEALPSIARESGLDAYAPCPAPLALAEIRAARAAGARAVFLEEPDYPSALRDVADAPPMLWTRGMLALAQRPAVAIVGARDASSLGARMARALARGLSEAGFAVVSGLARGVDAVAHQAALKGGTIAVTAGGCDVVYPPQNASLMGRIASDGLIVSEQPMGLSPQARHFPRRNRIVSGLARAVVVVEAATRSGTLITARAALDQGREVLAVPGHPFDGRASGCNALIRDGAVLVRGVEDVLAAIEAAGSATPGRVARPGTRETASSGPDAPRSEPPCQGRPSDPEEAEALRSTILSLLGPSPVAEDQVIRDVGLPAEAVLPTIMAMELDGMVERRPGGLLALAA